MQPGSLPGFFYFIMEAVNALDLAELIERANQMIARLSKEAMNKDNLIEKGVFR